MSGVIRSTEQIVARIEEVKDNDLFGAEVSNLVVHLPYEQAKPFLNDQVTKEGFEEVAANSVDIRGAAVDYLTFAIGKIVQHRGLSAGRSVNHFSAWLWLLFPDEEFARFEGAAYENYGAPQVKVAAELLGAEDAWAAAVSEHDELAPMAAGEPCRPGCDEGCGS